MVSSREEEQLSEMETLAYIGNFGVSTMATERLSVAAIPEIRFLVDTINDYLIVQNRVGCYTYSVQPERQTIRIPKAGVSSEQRTFHNWPFPRTLRSFFWLNTAVATIEKNYSLALESGFSLME